MTKPTRDFRRTVADRLHRDPAFAAALAAEAAALVRAAGPDAARLAAELGLIGGFRSAEGDLAERHSVHVKSRLRAKRAAESVPASGLVVSPSARCKP